METKNHPTVAPPRALIIVENDVFPQDPRVWNEARSLRDAGYRVTVISPTGKGKATRFFESIDCIDVYRFSLPSNASGVLGFIGEYTLAAAHIMRLSLRVLRHGGFDVVQVCNPPDIFFVHGLLYKFFGKAFIFDQHDLAPELYQARFGGGNSSPIFRVLRMCERLTYRVSDAVIATNASIGDNAIQLGNIDPSRVFVVRNGPNKQRMQLVAPDPALKQGRPYLVCFEGYMGPQDGVDLAVRAANWIVRNAGRTDVSFVFLGDGEKLPALKDLVHELGIDSYVDFRGLVDGDTLMQYLCTADVGLAPDPLNGLNERLTHIKIMEYMAARVPIVAFDLKETRFSAQEAAAYAEPNDYRKFGRVIIDLLDDPVRRRRMGEIGRKRVEDALSWEHSRPQLLAAYGEALARRSVHRAGLYRGGRPTR